MQPLGEPRRFTFYPDNKHLKRLKRKAAPTDSWVAPEHARVAMSMHRDFPRDDMGRRVEGKGRELVVDPRPNIMRPEPRPIYLSLDRA